jgi:hypothetical protein
VLISYTTEVREFHVNRFRASTNLSSLVFGSGDEVCPVGGPLKVRDVKVVNFDIIELLSRLYFCQYCPGREERYVVP